jgi:hypothetical protein
MLDCFFDGHLTQQMAEPSRGTWVTGGRRMVTLVSAKAFVSLLKVKLASEYGVSWEGEDGCWKIHEGWRRTLLPHETSRARPLWSLNRDEAPRAAIDLDDSSNI